MCLVTEMPQAAFTSWLEISVSVEETKLCWGHISVYIEGWWGMGDRVCCYGNWTHPERCLCSDRRIYGVFGAGGAAVCVTSEAAGFGLLGSYGNLNLPDWLLVVLMFKRHLTDRHMHKHMIEFRSGRTNLRVCLAVKLEKGIKESYLICTNRENI